ncbi:MAG: DUF456 domain-containing protein [Verrucomicrobia bacterium]|nr:DUF456 domain-containing protein [Verrucomicrobiota bacterium]
METFLNILQGGGILLLHAVIILLCLGGIVLSCLSISGTWLVAVGALLGLFIVHDGSPGPWTVVVFLLISVLVEVVEALASAWGVKRQGGSNLAGFAALAGGLVGMIVGTPVPVIGSLIGMLIGSFLCAYLVERHWLKKKEHAVKVAWGAVVARLLTVLVKVVATMGMTVYLALVLYAI